ncbi:hypothetical protein J6590_107356, partial [Homalodisca vitripennis]
IDSTSESAAAICNTPPLYEYTPALRRTNASKLTSRKMCYNEMRLQDTSEQIGAAEACWAHNPE